MTNVVRDKLACYVSIGARAFRDCSIVLTKKWQRVGSKGLTTFTPN